MDHPSTIRTDIGSRPPDGAVTYGGPANVEVAMSRPLPRRLVGIWAHPDDEAYLSAGLMARVADAGGEVTVITATRGEKGTSDPDRFDRDEFGLLREAELTASLVELGVAAPRLLDHRDGECDLADHDRAVSSLVEVLTELQPDAVVTFGPDGMTNHPDHRAVSRWATDAWCRVGVGELLYATLTHDVAARYEDLHERIGVYADCDDGRPSTVARRDLALECELSDAELDRKRRALAAHASQTETLAATMGEETYRAWFRRESFRRPSRSELLAARDAGSTDRTGRCLVGVRS